MGCLDVLLVDVEIITIPEALSHSIRARVDALAFDLDPLPEGIAGRASDGPGVDCLAVGHYCAGGKLIPAIVGRGFPDLPSALVALICVFSGGGAGLGCLDMEWLAILYCARSCKLWRYLGDLLARYGVAGADDPAKNYERQNARDPLCFFDCLLDRELEAGDPYLYAKHNVMDLPDHPPAVY